MAETGISFPLSGGVTGRALSGHLRVEARARAGGETYLARQAFRAPMHLSKPYRDAGALVVNAVNPTAGYFEGDRVGIEASVGAGASMVLTSPSAARTFAAPGGGMAEIASRYRVEAGGWLEVNPPPWIPHAGSRASVRARIEIGACGEGVFFESLTPGRVAAGEAFAFAGLDWETELVDAGRTVMRERYRLDPADRSLAGLRRGGGDWYYASCLAVLDREGWRERFARCAAELEGVLAGATAKGERLAVAKILAPDSPSLQRALGALREAVYGIAGRPVPRLRRF